MPAVTTNPHDMLFKETFSNIENAVVELRAALPSSLFERLDLASLEVVPGSFVDEDLSAVHSDLLYRVQLAGRPALVYVLLEHQSTVDTLMPLRLLGYLVRILERHAREADTVLPLPVVIPVVLHHSSTGWTAPTSLLPLFDVDALGPDVARLVPDFHFILDDISRASDTELMARTAQDARKIASLVLWALRDSRTVKRLFSSLPVWAPLFGDVGIPPESLRLLMSYLLQVVEELSAETLIGTIVQHATASKEAIMTVAEQLRQQGREESREAQQKTLRQMLTLKFGAIAPVVSTKVANADTAALNEWMLRVLTASSAEDVVA